MSEGEETHEHRHGDGQPEDREGIAQRAAQKISPGKRQHNQ
jgi:hypothetical protein